MITAEELNPHHYLITPGSDISKNLGVLHERINKVRTAWGKPMVVTSGLRSAADQARINPKAPKSNHLTGSAVDIGDPDGTLYAWTLSHLALMKEIGLWIEQGTHGWVHYQIVPPRSGNRVFIP